MNALDPRVKQELEALAIAHEVLDCDENAADTEVFCANYSIPRENAANAIVVVSKNEPRQYFACLVTASMKLDVNHKLRSLVGTKRLSFASAEETRDLTGQAIGGVTVFGLPEPMPLLIDQHVMDREYVIVGGGNRTTKLRVPPAELLKLPRARVADIAIPR
jgi:prolyl-tRNA editing enzyme YbaK/EbsC (Cys-tRNA(Pro) deacylase)